MGKGTFRDKTKLKSACLWSTITKIIFIPISLITSWLLSKVVTYAIDGDVANLVSLSIIVLILLFASIVLRMGCNILINKLHTKIVNDCRYVFLEKLLSNPSDKLYKADHGELTENLNDDLTSYIDRYIKLYPDILSSVLTMIGYIIFLGLGSPIVVISLIVVSMLQLFPPLIVKKYMKTTYDDCRKIEAQITDHVVEAVNAFESIKMYRLNRWWMDKMAVYHKKYLFVGHKADAVATAQRSMYKLLDNILKFGTYMLIGIFVILKYCDADVAIQALYLSSGLFSATKQIFSAISKFAVSNQAENRIEKWNLQNCITNSDFNSYTKGIVLKNLRYSYDQNLIIDVKNFHFYIDKNYLLTGENGAGKTTVINLLVGLLYPECGNIVIDGYSPFNLTNDNRTNLIFFVPQNDPVYSFTAYTLFRMFDNKIQEQICLYTARFELTNSNINELPICKLSGGERKKVFLSIAFAVSPRWLLLDEPSNNLDAHSKDVLIELVRERKGTIIISHDNLFHGEVDDIVKIESGNMYYEKKRESKTR